MNAEDPCMSDDLPVGQKLRATRETSLTQFNCCSFQIRFLFIASLVDRTWKAAPELRRSSIGPRTFSFFLFRSLETESNRARSMRTRTRRREKRASSPNHHPTSLSSRFLHETVFFLYFCYVELYYDRYVVACLYICISERKRKYICVTNAGRGRTSINFNVV